MCDKIVGGGYLLQRRNMMNNTSGENEYVTSITGEKIKILQVVPKRFDPNGLSIHDEIFEENGKRYLKKQVKDGITGIMPVTTSESSVVVFVPKINWRPVNSETFISFEHNVYYNNTVLWIDSAEITKKDNNNLKLEPKGIGISYSKGANYQFRIMNPNDYPKEKLQKIISNQSFRYAVPEEKNEIIEII